MPQPGLDLAHRKSYALVAGRRRSTLSERFNGTIRERLASLTRQCRHANLHLEPFQWGMYLIGCTYTLCWSHHQLEQTPAMAAGFTDYAWSLQQVLTYKVTPQLLANMQEVQRQDLVQLPDKKEEYLTNEF